MLALFSTIVSAPALVQTDVLGNEWELLVKQDSRKRKFFSRATAMTGKVGSPSDDLYMNLAQPLKSFKGADGKMTLQLRWPELTTMAKTLTWKQSSSPMARRVSGYEIEASQVHDWNGYDDFKGLSKSTSRSTLLDGQPEHGHWWYAVGSYRAYGKATGIPGPRGTGKRAYNKIVDRVELWVLKKASGRVAPSAPYKIHTDKDGKRWQLLVNQDSRKKKFFPSDAKFTGMMNADDVHADLYSNLRIDYSSMRDASGKMKLKLVYPELKTKELVWRQSSEPLKSKVSGYEIAPGTEYDWDGYDDFKGLSISSTSVCILDGQPEHGHWWYAVGSTRAYGKATGIPGPRGTGRKTLNKIVSQVQLWAEVACDASRCGDWDCSSWCKCFDDKFESIYAANGCVDDDDEACDCSALKTAAPTMPPTMAPTFKPHTKKGWTLLVKQDSRTRKFFNKAQALTGTVNVANPNGKLYMNLNQNYDSFRDASGKITLQIRWPTLKGMKKTLTWKQASSPLEKSVSGYQISKFTKHDWDGYDDFKGMSRSSTGVTLLDGQPEHGHWWYAVGSYRPYGLRGTGIPGPRGTGRRAYNKVVNYVELWVKN